MNTQTTCCCLAFLAPTDNKCRKEKTLRLFLPAARKRCYFWSAVRWLAWRGIYFAGSIQKVKSFKRVAKSGSPLLKVTLSFSETAAGGSAS